MAEDVNPNELEIGDELIAERRSSAPGQLPDDMPRWHVKLITIIDTITALVGRLASFMVIPLCFAMVYEVLVRKFGVDPTLYLPEVWRMMTDPEAESLVIPKPTPVSYTHLTLPTKA